MKKSLFFMAAIAVWAWSFAGQAQTDGAIVTGRTPPAPYVATSPPSLEAELVPIKNCAALITELSAEHQKRQGRPPHERAVALWRQDCQEEAARDEKLNQDMRAKFPARLAEWRRQEEDNKKRVEIHRATFFAEEKAAGESARRILANSGVKDWGNPALLRDNAHLLQGKFVALEASLVQRLDERSLIFQIPGWTSILVLSVPPSAAVMAGQNHLLIGRVRGIEVYEDHQSRQLFRGPALDWVALESCRLSLPDGLRQISAQCLPLLALRHMTRP